MVILELPINIFWLSRITNKLITMSEYLFCWRGNTKTFEVTSGVNNSLGTSDKSIFLGSKSIANNNFAIFSNVMQMSNCNFSSFDHHQLYFIFRPDFFYACLNFTHDLIPNYFIADLIFFFSLILLVTSGGWLFWLPHFP